MRRQAVAIGLAMLALGAAMPGAAAAPLQTSLPLPQPVYDVSALPGIGLRPDRLARSKVPGPTSTREQVEAALGPDGAPAAVTVTEHILVTGTGDYVIRQRGPARRADPIGDTVPPVVKLGTVLWQGFSPGRRELAARLVLDAALEAPRLPLAVQLAFHDRNGRPVPLAPGAVTPAAGTVTVTLTNQTSAPVPVTAGTAAPATAAHVLDAMRAAAVRSTTSPAPPPAPGRGLPASVAGTASGQSTIDVTAPLRVTGTITAGADGVVSGPGTTAVRGGARVAGTLSGQVSWTVSVSRSTALGLDLTAAPTLDPRALTPPDGAASWSAWARKATAANVTSALLLHTATATRAAEYVGYLSLDAATGATTAYHFTVAPRPRAGTTAATTSPDAGGITAAVVALLAILGNAYALRRLL